MRLPRDAHAESSVLHEFAPRKRPLQHATISLLATSPILGTNSISGIEKTLYRGVILSRSLVARCDHLKKFFHIAGIAVIPRFTFLWSVRFVLAQIDCKTESQFQVSSLGCGSTRRTDLDDLCSSTLRQQRSNLVNQSVARFYLLISEVVLGTVSGQSLKFSLLSASRLTPCTSLTSLVTLS